MFDRLEIIVPVAVPVRPERCSCGNWKFANALVSLMCNHWSSQPNTQKRQEQIVSSISGAIRLLAADIDDNGHPYFKVDVSGKPYDDWTDGEKIMHVCPGCYRAMLEAPAQLPPESKEITVRQWDPAIPSAPRRSRRVAYIRKVAQICEWLTRSG